MLFASRTNVGNKWVQKMKTEWFKMRMSERRLNKLRLYAAIKDTTMTRVVEELIDSLKIPEIGNQVTDPTPASTDGKHRSGVVT